MGDPSQTIPLFAVAPLDDPSNLPSPVASSLAQAAMSTSRVLFTSLINAGGGTAADINPPEPFPAIGNIGTFALHVKNFSYGQLNTNPLQDLNGWVGIDALPLNGANFNPASGTGLHAGLATIDFGYGFDGVNFQALRTASAANLALQSGLGAQLVRHGGDWSQHSEPAVNVQATTTRAAGGAGVRHVCTSISATLNAVAAIAAPISLYLRDGATGVGPILRSWRFVVPIGETAQVDLSGLNIVGSANTAMTLEWGAAPGAGNFENASITGYSAA